MYRSNLFILSVFLVVSVSLINASSNGDVKVSPFFKKHNGFAKIPEGVFLETMEDAGEAVYLNEYLDNPEVGRRKSCVDINKLVDGTPFGDCSMLDNPNDPLTQVTPFTYSGFFQVNETYDQNLFYWFFESQDGNKDAPVVLWLQGGPGGSSLFGLFVENGPYAILENLTMVPRNVTWNEHFSMLYVDNPVGTGFSYTNSMAGYSSNQDQIAANLHSLLVQFFGVFPQYANNDFYVAGESYAGKYVPALGYYIIQQNKLNPSNFINLAGIAVGDGLCDPVTQVTQYANLAFYMGLADLGQQNTMSIYQDKIIQAILSEQWMEANDLFTDLINGPPDYFQNITGEPDYYDIRKTVEPTYGGNFEAFVNSSMVRNLLHVGNNYFQDNNNVYLALQADIPKSIKPLIPTIIENVKVLFYNGQFDFIVGASLTETFMRTIPWEGIPPFVGAERTIWKIPSDQVNVAGYVRQYLSLTQVVVRGAGHILPYDQPERAYDMITRFVNNVPFTN
ncbi:peptidase S10 family protein [Heterostelium album PN500]|uniref:Carboxypeptidase n=1 Tax=Heterostelium pallidum (strain ATCC 26659 / Pp 5 / PN500) TaxID=670386 RepID=D3BB25_HETP5|nr:peptidase S10 family protein [Heterostelium album PN500]EFA81762.1 peptidase S10 family protein [Heterostelium album PN500]|eukprot:XP_020433879.1 peptidase S10 family protein [Heterostelium album PN500]